MPREATRKTARTTVAPPDPAEFSLGALAQIASYGDLLLVLAQWR
jgi:hypothetical protein